jgi:hypothetical protein
VALAAARELVVVGRGDARELAHVGQVVRDAAERAGETVVLDERPVTAPFGAEVDAGGAEDGRK